MIENCDKGDTNIEYEFRLCMNVAKRYWVVRRIYDAADIFVIEMHDTLAYRMVTGKFQTTTAI